MAATNLIFTLSPIIHSNIKMRTFLLLIIVACINLAQAQESSLDTIPSVNFPEDWLGYWEGTLDIYNDKGLAQSIPMALDHSSTEADSIWTWAIIYGEDTIAGRRDYSLKVEDASAGHYYVDENNYILLDGFHRGNHFISTFKVQGNYLMTDYKLDGEELIFTIHFFPEKEIRTTGGTKQGEEEIPFVYSYKNTVLQEARLRRKKN